MTQGVFKKWSPILPWVAFVVASWLMMRSSFGLTAMLVMSALWLEIGYFEVVHAQMRRALGARGRSTLQYRLSFGRLARDYRDLCGEDALYRQERRLMPIWICSVLVAFIVIAMSMPTAR